MASDTVDVLKRVDVFKHLDVSKLKQMASLVSVHRFAEKQVIYMPSDPRSRLYAILSGKVKLTQLSPEGKELVLCVLGKGEVFGELSTLVYEAYYVQPAVWGLLGYEPYPTGEAGPSMDPFDVAALERVRSAPALYREVL